MKKYKYIIVILSIIIFLILGVVIYINTADYAITFTLLGNNEMSIYEGGNYTEYGYVFFDADGNNISNKVTIKNKIDTNKVGTYKVKYIAHSKFKKYTRERIIHVVKDDLKYIDFSLNGNEIINLQIGQAYNDPKFKCINKDTGENLTKYVVIENSVNNLKEGKYEIIYRLRYDSKEKVLTRKVYVFKQLMNHTLNNTSLTNKPVSAKIKTFIHDFAYIVCPNDKVVYNNVFTYNFYENGKYTFYVYDYTKNYEEYVITINNIDMVPPSGTCKASLLNGKTSYNVSSKDDDIDRILYNDEERYASVQKKFTAPLYQRAGIVSLVDKAGNKTKIKCNVTRNYLPVIKPGNNEKTKYHEESDSLVVNVSYQDGYYFTRIWAKDPYLQMKKQMLSSSSKSLKLPKIILEEAIKSNSLQKKLIIASNASGPVMLGSHYSYVAEADMNYNLKEPSALLVYNGKVIINDYKNYSGNGVIYYINGNNKLSYIPSMERESPSERKKVFDEALDGGVYNTFTFSSMLVVDKKVQSVTSDYNALRNGFCQLDENNFISIVSKNKTWLRPDFAKFMASLGCVNAANFDGGGSVALFYKSKNNNNVETLSGNGRALSSVMYFTELN